MDRQSCKAYKAVLENPEHADSYAELTRHFLSAGSLHKSIKSHEISILLSPKSSLPERLALLGRLYFQIDINLKPQIETFYRRFCSLNPEKNDAIEYLHNLISSYKYTRFTKEAHSGAEFNSPGYISKLYEDEDVLRVYLDSERIKFYENVVCLLHKKLISADWAGKVADVGCGSGHLLLSMQRQFPNLELTGFEYVESAIAMAKRVVPKAEIKWLDITSESFAVEEQYEAVFCTEVLEHLATPSLALKNLLTLVQPSGLLIITVPDGRVDTFIGHIHFWSPESWRHFLDQAVDPQSFITEIGLLDQTTNYAIIKKIGTKDS